MIQLTSLTMNELLSQIRPDGSVEKWAKAVCSVISHITESSLTVFYKLPKTQTNQINKSGWLYLHAQIGHTTAPKRIPAGAEFLQAAAYSDSAVVQNNPSGPFSHLLLNSEMQSGIAVLLGEKAPYRGLLIANYSAPYHYNGAAIKLFEHLRTIVKFTPQNSGGKT